MLIHIGEEVPSDQNRSTPRKVAAILDRFPRLRIIAAHMGGYRFWEQALEVLAGRDLYLDTSSAQRFMAPALFRQLVTRHGASWILFGSDYPVWSPAEELAALRQLDWLSESEKVKILGDNSARLLGVQ